MKKREDRLYKIVGGDLDMNCEAHVNELLEAGWDLHGDLQVVLVPPEDGVYDFKFFQVMTREEVLSDEPARRPKPPHPPKIR